MTELNSLAVIPARGGSKRIPKKNIRPFMGKPIIAYSIEMAKRSGCFDSIMVSTDDQSIADVSNEYGAEVPFLRSPQTADDYAPLADVIDEVIASYFQQEIHIRYICCILATAPLIVDSDLQKSFELLKNHNAESVVSVVRFSYPIQRAFKISKGLLQLISPEHLNSRSNDLEPSFHDAAQFYWIDVEKFQKNKKIFSDYTIPYELSETQVQDIDTETDWKMAEYKYSFLINKP